MKRGISIMIWKKEKWLLWVHTLMTYNWIWMSLCFSVINWIWKLLHDDSAAQHWYKSMNFVSPDGNTISCSSKHIEEQSASKCIQTKHLTLQKCKNNLLGSMIIIHDVTCGFYSSRQLPVDVHENYVHVLFWY